LLVISAPSGAGKTTLCDRLLIDLDRIGYSVSYSTRSPREGELNGRDYFFLSEEEFKELLDRGEFLEHAVVHGNLYGTSRQAVLELLASGMDVLMDIDVAGARQIRERIAVEPEDSPLRAALVDIFIAPPSMRELRRRLIDRDQDSSDDIEHRLTNAEDEMSCAGEYMHLIVNDDLEKAYAELRSTIESERRKTEE
jgi:guanylate kinase